MCERDKAGEDEFSDKRIRQGIFAGGVLVGQGKLGCLEFLSVLAHIAEAASRGIDRLQAFELFLQGKKAGEAKRRQGKYNLH